MVTCYIGQWSVFTTTVVIMYAILLTNSTPQCLSLLIRLVVLVLDKSIQARRWEHHAKPLLDTVMDDGTVRLGVRFVDVTGIDNSRNERSMSLSAQHEINDRNAIAPVAQY